METIIQQAKKLFHKTSLQYISHMIDIYKEQKDEVEIRIKQLKERRKNNAEIKITEKYITPTNKRVPNVTLL